MLRKVRALSLLTVPLLMVACAVEGGDGAASGTPSPDLPTTQARYADAAPTLASWSDPVLDVVAAPGTDGAPLVVVFPPHGLTSSDPATSALARALARRGAVTVVANWSQLDDPPAAFQDPGTLARFASAGQSAAGCAVSYAVAHAAEYGADASRLVLVGDLFGANTAAMVALTTPPALPGCRGTATWRAAGLVPIDGDWLVAYDAFDAVPAAAVAALSPWLQTAGASGVRVTLLSTDAAMSGTRRCSEADAAWLSGRDPAGRIRAQLRATGALADGCLDLRESAAAFAVALQAAGATATVAALPNADGASRFDSGFHFQTVGPSDLSTIADAVLAAAG